MRKAESFLNVETKDILTLITKEKRKRPLWSQKQIKKNTINLYLLVQQYLRCDFVFISWE